MKIEYTATLRLGLWELDDIGTTPQKVSEELQPDNCVNRVWIPQTLGEQIWLWFEFGSIEDKETFINGIPKKYTDIHGFLATNFIQSDLDYWVRETDKAGIRE